jgi:2-amino-4-hydroxy-6-hydroxymethyldihydropteridine diphosphokinase
MAWTAIGIGSNLGDRPAAIASAVAELAGLGTLLAVSPLFETAPVGGPEQGPFLNAVAVVDTDLEPRALLEGLLAIERSMGRERAERWGPRSIDLDLLIHDSAIVDEPGLMVPHPRMLHRRFVLYPLLTVWPRPELPDGTSLAAAAAAVADQEVTAVTGGYDVDAGGWRPL